MTPFTGATICLLCLRRSCVSCESSPRQTVKDNILLNTYIITDASFFWGAGSETFRAHVCLLDRVRPCIRALLHLRRSHVGKF